MTTKWTRARTLPIVLGLSLGCAAETAERKASCLEQMRELATWTQALAKEETGVWAKGDLVTATFASDAVPTDNHGGSLNLGTPRPTSPDLAFGLDTDGVTLEGERIWSTRDEPALLAAAIDTTLQRHLQRMRMIASARNERLALRGATLLIAPRVDWWVVARTLTEIERQGFVEVYFYFSRTVAVAAPPPSAVDQALAKFEREMTDGEAIDSMVPHHLKRIYMLREQMRVVLANCPESLAAYDRTASGRLPAQFSDEILQCRCQPDIGAIRGVLWHSRRPSTGAIVTVQLSAADGPNAVVALPADTPWSLAHASIVKAARRTPAPALSFAVKP